MIDDEHKITLYEFKKRVSNFVTLFELQQQTILINESGFYSLVIKSRKEVAKNFRRWVTSEVLSSIRKTVKYEIENSHKQLELELQQMKLKEIKLNHLTLELENDNKR